jgi:SAM-dependent methyltransferase
LSEEAPAPHAARLAQHYDAKYGGERAAPGTAIARAHRAPADRHEACLTYFPRHFRGGDILEIGAGDGLVARSLAAAGVPFEHYTATEYSEARLDGLRRSLSDPRVRVAKLDLEAPPGEHAHRYDAVILLALVEHLVDPLAGLRHVREMLRPGGFAFVDTPNIAKYSRRVKLLFGRFPSTASRDEGLATWQGAPVDLHDEGHLHYFTYRSLSRLLVERCGFSRTVPAPYVTPPHLFGRRVDAALARWRPQLFAELCLVAYA